jgi:predicted nucleic acid-binding protein
MKVYFDTDVLVAALKVEHIHHERSYDAIARVSTGDLEGFISCQSLAETYSVLTRTPFRSPVYPDEALTLLERTIVPILRVIAVSAESYRTALRVCASSGWKGGRIHDAVHVQSAVQGGCDCIYTFDIEHFKSVAGAWTGRILEPPQL